MTKPELEGLFAASLTMPAGLNRLADELLAAAQRVGRFVLEADDRRLTATTDDCVVSLDAYQRLARPLFARIAKVVAEEGGREFDPYAGHAVLRRSSEAGPVELDVETSNTPDAQFVRITSRSLCETNDLPDTAGASNRDEVVQKL